MPKFEIQDWAGNRLTAHGTFKTFEDAWDYILGDMSDKLKLTEEDYGEYYVMEVGPAREKRYLDPKDPRGSQCLT